MESNVPGGAEGEGGQTSSNNNQTKNETVNYEISRTVSRIVEPTGTIKKLSVAVLVDGTYEGGGKAAEGAAEQPKKYVPRSEEEMKRIEEIVKKAMGYSTERQDQVEVVSIQFGLGVEEPVGAGVEAARLRLSTGLLPSVSGAYFHPKSRTVIMTLTPCFHAFFSAAGNRISQ